MGSRYTFGIPSWAPPGQICRFSKFRERARVLSGAGMDAELRRLSDSVKRWGLWGWLVAIGVFAALHALNLRADFPNHSPWVFDWAKYTDEGWFGNAAMRAHLLAPGMWRGISIRRWRCRCAVSGVGAVFRDRGDARSSAWTCGGFLFCEPAVELSAAEGAWTAMGWAVGGDADGDQPISLLL